MLIAAILVCALALAGCPRMTNETVPVSQPPASKVPKKPARETRHAKPELEPPIPWLALATNMEPAPLPGAITDQHPQAEVSDDKSKLWAEGKGGAPSHWYQAFVTPANDKTLRVYFDGLLGVRGFGSTTPMKQEPGGGGLKLAWRADKEPYHVEVFDSGTSTTAAKPQPIYVIHIVENKDQEKSSANR